MTKTSNKKSRTYVQNFQEFQANNLEGKYINGVYVVLSYGYYPVFVYKDGKWYENTNRYSVSTAKQMTQCRPVPNTELKSTDDLKALYKSSFLGIL